METCYKVYAAAKGEENLKKIYSMRSWGAVI